MTTGTKVFLAVFALIVGILVLYYGVIMPNATTVTAGAPAASVSNSGMRSSSQAATDRHDAVPFTAGQTGADRVHPTSDGGTPKPSSGSGAEPTAPGAAGTGAVETGATETPDGDQSGPTAAYPERAISRSPLDMFPVGLTPNLPTHAEANTPVTIPVSNGAGGDGRATTPHPVHAVRANTPAPVAVTDNKAARTSAGPETTVRKASPPRTFDYTVKSGDTMSSIAEAWLGDRNKWSLIAKENPLVDPSTLRIGQKLLLPPKDAQPAKVRDQIAADKNTYIVRSGDTLAKIARELFNDVSKWEAIYNANKGVIGSDPSELKAGMKLAIPDLTKKSSAAPAKSKSA